MTQFSDFLGAIAAIPAFENAFATIGAILAAMAALALVEAAIPLHSREGWNRFHLAPNLGLTFITFATNIVFNTALVLLLAWLQTIGFGILHQFPLPPLVTLVVVVLALDFSFYGAHVAMHEVPAFWRYHRVHHSDPAVDVTTTIRQHPGESVIRYAFLAVFAAALGVSPAAFAVYRVQSVLQGLFEHSNIRLPRWFDTMLSLVITSPNMHKVHHARDARYTDRNFGNITSLWDRLFLTFVSARVGEDVVCGLDGFDERGQQGFWGLLAMPYRRPRETLVDERS